MSTKNKRKKKSTGKTVPLSGSAVATPEIINPVDEMALFFRVNYSQHARFLDMQEFLSRMSRDIGSRSYAMAELCHTFETNEEKLEYILDVMPPNGGLYHSNSPCPNIFRQHNEIHIHMITTDIRNLISDPMFWWQPVSDPAFFQALQPLNELISNYKPEATIFSIGLLRSTLTI